MTERNDAPQSHAGQPLDVEGTARSLRGLPTMFSDEIKSQIKNYNKTGRRLVTLGVLLEILLGAVTVPLAFAVYNGIHAFIEEAPNGLVLPGVLMGIGIAVAGVFYAAAKMLDAIPAILTARNDNAAKILESLRIALAESGSERAPSA